jgi:putative toxin-antitoxin system antitoxin component (TIGR02293 family)
MNPRTRIAQYESLKDLRRKGPVAEEAQAALAGERPSVIEIRALANSVFGDEAKAERWLGRPNTSLGGQAPLDLMKDELGLAVVRETLEQIAHGIVA